jgi:hypothetical protein
MARRWLRVIWTDGPGLRNDPETKLRIPKDPSASHATLRPLLGPDVESKI